VEKTRKKLEADYPKLTRIQLASSQPAGPVVDLSDDAAQIMALQAKLKVLNSQMERLTTEAKVVNELEPAITDLQRERDLEEAKYRHFSTSLEQARFDDALGAGKMSNISVAQEPSPAFRESRKMIKAISMIAIGGVVAGFALAFLIELFLDPSVRRPTEVEARLHLPLFLTIPRMRRNGRPALPAPAVPAAGQPGPGEAGAEPGANKKSAVAPWQANGLAAYYEALRDRLVTYFEVHNLLHKPKLIAVTGCGKGAGVTTIATGLAASLSETGDGNVLLVDMTTGQGAAHPFFKGKLGVGLADALSSGTRDNALVQENLYMVAESGKGGLLPRVLPRRFSNLVPKLKTSDYDYIIFDMPPVSQISVTARLAGFMDTVLRVIESEKTDRELVKRATAKLAESKATVCAVLNKHHDYVPQRLSQDL
jgi:Mrp family chromosome partitioning ATPase